MRKYVIIVIPEVIRKPKFNLGEDQELTLDEQVKLQDYEDKLSNYIDISTILNTWPINGDWKKVIDDKGPIYIKDSNRYHVYCLNANRIDRIDVKSFISREERDLSDIANIEMGYIAEWTPQEWLENNGYVKENIKDF